MWGWQMQLYCSMSSKYKAIITDLRHILLMKYTTLEKYNREVTKEFLIWIILFILSELKWLVPSKNN